MPEAVTGTFRVGKDASGEPDPKVLELVPTWPTNETFTDGGWKPGRRYVMRLFDGDGPLTASVRDVDGRAVSPLSPVQQLTLFAAKGSGIQDLFFDPKDGLGIRLLMRAGIGVGIVTGRRSEALMHRCRDLGIELVFDGIDDKAAVLPEVENRTGIAAGQMAYAGDDLPDLPLMKRVGVALAVADAHEEVVSRADWVTRTAGGQGAVREICEAILKAQNLWEGALAQFLG